MCEVIRLLVCQRFYKKIKIKIFKKIKKKNLKNNSMEM